jgi:hypothetical protein
MIAQTAALGAVAAVRYTGSPEVGSLLVAHTLAEGNSVLARILAVDTAVDQQDPEVLAGAAAPATPFFHPVVNHVYIVRSSRVSTAFRRAVFVQL